MNYLWSESFAQHCNFPLKEDILVQKIYHTHDPDGRDPDPELLLRMIQTVLHYATPMQVSDDQPYPTVLNNVDVDESQEATLGCIIQTISHKIISQCYDKGDIYSKALDLFNLLGKYKWDAKLLLALSAFAMIYGGFWLILQSKNQNSLAALIAPFKQLPENLHPFKPIFKAIDLLVKAMVEITRCVVEYEGLPIRQIHLDTDEIAMTRSLIYVAAFWVMRSILVCTSWIEKLKDMEDKQEPISIIIALWELASLESRINSTCTELKSQMETCRQQAEMEMHQRLRNVFDKPHADNQQVLRELFALKTNLPLKDPSLETKIGVSALQDQIVILLISRPELLDVEESLLLVQQTNDHSLQHTNLNRTYKILWVPITATGQWTDKDILIFSFLSNSLPWYSIQRPWLLSSATVDHIKREWEFNDKPLMVVLDSQGMVTNVNALDMIWIWGVTAYPFSTSREEEMWRKQIWTLELIVDQVDPLLSTWVEEGRTICIYGSSNLYWIREFSAKMKMFQNIDPKLEVVYVGNKSPANNRGVIDIVSAIEIDKLGSSLSLTKIRLFWLRLASMRRSLLKLRMAEDTTDHILKEVSALLEFSTKNDASNGWMIIAKGGSSAPLVKLQGDEVIMECLNNLQQWKKYLPKLGLLNTIRISQQGPLPPEPCPHSRITAYNDEQTEEVILCQKCHRPMEKFVVYDVVQ